MPCFLTDNTLCVFMSLKSEKNYSKNLVSFLAIADLIDRQSKQLAQKLNEVRYVYHAYAVLDSLNASYSMFKYIFDVFLSNGDPNLMHEVLTSPEGVAIVTSELFFLVPFALLASFFDGKKKKSKDSAKGDFDKHPITYGWSCFRDAMSGLRSGYKGWRSVIQIINVIGKTNLKYLISPIGLALGVLAAAIRVTMRFVQKRRDKQIINNKSILDSFLSKIWQFLESCQIFKHIPKRQVL